jgi:hypothetical protein
MISRSDFDELTSSDTAALWAENGMVRIFMLEARGSSFGCLLAANRIAESLRLGFHIEAMTSDSRVEGTRILIVMTRLEESHDAIHTEEPGTRSDE